MFTSIRIFKTIDEKLDDDLIRQIENEFTPILRSVAGFHAYRMIDSGNHQVASISFFETKEGADESVAKSREWVAEHLAHLIDGAPTVFIGEQIFSALA